MKTCHLAGRVDKNAAHLSETVALVEAAQTDAALELCAFPYHDVAAETRAPAAELIAELRFGIGVARSAAVHAVATCHQLTRLQVVDEEAFLARGYREVYKDVILRVVSPALAVVSYLFYAFRVYLAVPFLAVHIVFPQGLGVPLIYRWYKRYADHNQEHHCDAKQEKLLHTHYIIIVS